eukprot:gnl/TRDRNA2_/TRDRNA2_137696_c1_seq1.p1 gnl/TRDRNA2_/TRDRNA2_137696_c1~~gnl/TRDRNA2_/TRDRNA2_137696_c1_seq1.p1  ORF type:complete len:533 (+),score=52.75 gnl/TRDRNA2_/TRDRNA2_137696_c1_seq1:236-1600(+)
MATKVAIFAFVLLAATCPTTTSLDQNLVGIGMWFVITIPLVPALWVLMSFFYLEEVNLVEKLRRRLIFSQSLHDIVKIVGSKSTTDLRAYALSMEYENDVQQVQDALDTLQFTMLGLQVNNRLKRRCGLHPFEIGDESRLEGELVHLGLRAPDDHRQLMRRLLSSLQDTETVSQGMECKKGHGNLRRQRTNSTVHYFDHESRSTRICKMIRLTCGSSGRPGLSFPLELLADRLDPYDIGVMSEEEFVSRCNSHLLKIGVLNFSQDDLRKIFDYIDFSSCGQITVEEVLSALLSVPNFADAAVEKENGPTGIIGSGLYNSSVIGSGENFGSKELAVRPSRHFPRSSEDGVNLASRLNTLRHVTIRSSINTLNTGHCSSDLVSPRGSHLPSPLSSHLGSFEDAVLPQLSDVPPILEDEVLPQTHQSSSSKSLTEHLASQHRAIPGEVSELHISELS